VFPDWFLINVTNVVFDDGIILLTQLCVHSVTYAMLKVVQHVKQTSSVHTQDIMVQLPP